MRSIIKWLVLVFVFLIVLGYWLISDFIQKGFPEHRGEVTVKGISSPVEIIRDEWGIPHIFGKSAEDVYLALGYAMAQDRLWQMELFRAAANGTLSEIFGKDVLETDIFLRRIQLRPANSAHVREQVSEEVWGEIQAFVRGINRYLAEKHPLPLEFRLVKHTPEPWDELDVIAIGKLQSWQLSYNYSISLLYHKIRNRIGDDKCAELFPFYPSEAPRIMDITETLSENTIDELLAISESLEDLLGTNGGSNNWVVSGARTTTGKPILCNDPHLYGSRLPGPWYFIHLSAPDLDVIGGAFPGLPYVLIGHNRSIAWGETNMGPDVQDLFLEKVNPENSNQYLFMGEWKDFEVKELTFRVKDKTAPSGYRMEKRRLKKTVHGPVISEENDEVLSLRWTGHDFHTEMVAFSLLNRASDWGEFKKALSYFCTAPQNFVYADTAGNIGYYGAGKIPIRKNGDGLLPVPGWTGDYEWVGFIPFEDLPHVFNPGDGYIITANNRIVSDDYPYPVPGIYAPTYRYERIRELILSADKTSVEDHQKFQQDNKSLLAARLVPILIDVVQSTGNYQEILDLLKQWDYVNRPDAIAPSIYHETFYHFMLMTFEDELGKDLARDYLDTWYISLERWVYMLEDSLNPWFDDLRTEGKETAQDILLAAFRKALDTLREKFGTPVINKWQWGKIHTVEFHHTFESKGGLIKKFFNYGPFPYGGDGESVNRATYSIGKLYDVTMTASMREVISLNDLANTSAINASGQVGQVTHEHYTDLCDVWLNGEYITWKMDRADILSRGKVLTLIPE